MVGPVVQGDSFSIINRFRFFKIALQVDIEKRYRQFGLKAEDRRDESTSELKHLRMLRVIYGVSC